MNPRSYGGETKKQATVFMVQADVSEGGHFYCLEKIPG